MRLFIFFILQVFFIPYLISQPDIYCTTPGDPAEPGWVDWLKNENETGPFFVMLKFHTNLPEISEDVIQSAVNKLGKYFDSENIFFGWDCNIYANTPISDGGVTNEPTVINILISDNNETSALGKPSAKLYIDKDDFNTIIFAHEIGHCLGLYHDFHKTGGIHDEGCPELVDRSDSLGNCTECGDCLCDTDATPYLEALNFDFNTCSYLGYTPSNDQRNFDLNGEAYNPGVETIQNIMSSTKDCRASFTLQQGNRMRNMLANAEQLSQLMHKDNPAVYLNEINGTVENTLLPDCNNGSIDITVDGGLGPFNYAWSNGETVEDVNNLEEGLYCVTVTDVFCNSITSCFSINCQCFYTGILKTFSDGVNTFTKDLHGSFQSNDGVSFPITVELIGAGHSSIYLNSYVDFQFTDLEIGKTYCLVYTDGDGCTFEDCFIVEGESCPDAFAITLEDLQHDVDCRDTGDGFINVSVETGHEQCDYVINWNTNPPQTGKIIRDLEAGTYCASIEGIENTACQNCLATICWEIGNTVSDPLPIVTNSSFEDFCYEDDNGHVNWTGILSMEIIGGAGVYDFNWDFDPVDQDQSGSNYYFTFNEEGNYCVTISDECGGSSTHCQEVQWQRYVEVRDGEFSNWEERECLRTLNPGLGSLTTGENKNLSVVIKPNPFSNEIKINILGKRDIEQQVQIINTLGNIVYSQTISKGQHEMIIDQFSNNPQGIYFIQLITPKQKQTIKVLKVD